MLLFITTYLLTIPFLFVVLLLGVVFEANDSNMSVFFGLGAATLAYFMFDVSLLTIGIAAVVYLIVGIVWSMWRYKRYVDTRVEYINAVKSYDENDRKREMSALELPEMIGRITAWVFVWPFSMIENVTSDLVRMVRVIITEALKSVYNKIHANAVSKLTPLPEKTNRTT